VKRQLLRLCRLAKRGMDPGLYHANGVAPRNSIVTLTANSRVVLKEYRRDASYEKAASECEGVARLLKVMAPVRIDIRRFRGGDGEIFALFDLDMKPVS
jgi:hypothetical protein